MVSVAAPDGKPLDVEITIWRHHILVKVKETATGRKLCEVVIPADELHGMSNIARCLPAGCSAMVERLPDEALPPLPEGLDYLPPLPPDFPTVG